MSGTRWSLRVHWRPEYKDGSKFLPGRKSNFPGYGWLGLVAVALFWVLNWTLSGARTHWGFFPLWLGYCLAIDALVFWRRGTSLLTRSPRRWEMWNNYSYPKWIYQVPGVAWLHIFEMPLLGFGGYLPFVLELYALYNWVAGSLGDKKTDYVRVAAGD